VIFRKPGIPISKSFYREASGEHRPKDEDKFLLVARVNFGLGKGDHFRHLMHIHFSRCSPAIGWYQAQAVDIVRHQNRERKDFDKVARDNPGNTRLSC
jgi:hypothetical protein